MENKPIELSPEAKEAINLLSDGKGVESNILSALNSLGKGSADDDFISYIDDMPIRCVITKRIENHNPGDIIDLDSNYFDALKSRYPDSIQKIEMTRQDWIDLATNNANKSAKRIMELQQLYGEEFYSRNMRVIPSYGEVDGKEFQGGLREAYEMTKQLQQDIEVFEEQYRKFGIHR
jgi:hypothetical protein